MDEITYPNIFAGIKDLVKGFCTGFCFHKNRDGKEACVAVHMADWKRLKHLSIM